MLGIRKAVGALLALINKLMWCTGVAALYTFYFAILLVVVSYSIKFFVAAPEGVQACLLISCFHFYRMYEKTYFFVTHPIGWPFLDWFYRCYASYLLSSSSKNEEYKNFGKLPIREPDEYDFTNIKSDLSTRSLLSQINRRLLGKVFNSKKLLASLRLSKNFSKDYSDRLETEILKGTIKLPIDFKRFNLNYFYVDNEKLDTRCDSYYLAFLETKINTPKGLSKFLNYWIDNSQYLLLQDQNKVYENSIDFGPFKNFKNKSFLNLIASISYDIQEFLFNLQKMENLGSLLPTLASSTCDSVFKSRVYHDNYLRLRSKKKPLKDNKNSTPHYNNFNSSSASENENEHEHENHEYDDITCENTDPNNSLYYFLNFTGVGEDYDIEPALVDYNLSRSIISERLLYEWGTEYIESVDTLSTFQIKTSTNTYTFPERVVMLEYKIDFITYANTFVVVPFYIDLDYHLRLGRDVIDTLHNVRHLDHFGEHPYLKVKHWENKCEESVN